MKLVGLLFILVFVWSCASSNEEKKPTISNEKQTLNELLKLEDSLRINDKNASANVDPKMGVMYADRCLDFAERFPKAKKAAHYTDKAHMVLAALGMHRRSAEVGEKLLVDFPFYDNRPMVIESVAMSYDFFILPRDKAKAEKYYQMLLKEDKKMSKEEREELEFRLANINLTFEELVEAQSAKSK